MSCRPIEFWRIFPSLNQSQPIIVSTIDMQRSSQRPGKNIVQSTVLKLRKSVDRCTDRPDITEFYGHALSMVSRGHDMKVIVNHVAAKRD